VIFTNIGLANHAEGVLLSGCYYLLGTYGQKATKAVYDETCARIPSNKGKLSYVSPAFGKSRFCDCYGLVKWYLMADAAGNLKYNPKYDRSSTSAYKSAARKGPLKDMPDVPGVILYLKGGNYDHVGIYAGGGKFIECAGGKGAAEGRVEGGKVTKGSKFTHWFMDTFIVYPAEAPSKTSPGGDEPAALRPGDKVTIISGAEYGGAAKGLKVPAAQLAPKTHTVDRIQTNNGALEALLKEIVSWVPVAGLKRCGH
jgi:cell wall-associated NlpC family hydrolase